MKIPFVDETSRATGSRLGRVQAFWADEASEKTKSKPTFGRLELSLKKMVALVYTTDELLEDQAALAAFVEQGFREEFSFMLDNAVIRGTGAGQPLGILNSNAKIAVAKEVSQAADTIKFANCAKMLARLPAESYGTAVWLYHPSCLPQLLTMSVDVKNIAGSENVGGSAAWIPQGGASGSPYSTLLGLPGIPCEQCAPLGDEGDIVLADFSQYVVISKDLQMASSIHVRFIYDESVYRFVMRVDGAPAWKQAVTPFQGSDTISPFITLAARA